MFHHPVWDRTCRMCSAYMTKADGTFTKDHRGGLVKRPDYIPTPCQTCPKPPIEAKQAGYNVQQLRTMGMAAEMDDRNRAAFQHYVECKAVGSFPNDPIVRWVAGLIRAEEDAHGRYLQERGAVALETAAELLILKSVVR